MVGIKGRSGRPANTSPEAIARAAVTLFETQGYADTSVTHIATAAGIARRTYFAYFGSKADAFWWSEQNDLLTVERNLAEAPVDGVHPIQQVIDIALRAPSWSRPDKAEARQRYRVIEENADLQIGAQKLQRRWNKLIATHMRERMGATRSDLVPEVVAAALLGVGQTLVVRWAYGDDERPLYDVLAENLATVRHIFEETVADGLLK